MKRTTIHKLEIPEEDFRIRYGINGKITKMCVPTYKQEERKLVIEWIEEN